MKLLWGVMFTLGCSKETATPPAPRPVPAPVAADAAATVCSVDGTYRLRFHSNGVDGWWLRLRVDNGHAEVTEKQEMLGLEKGPIDASVDPKACKLKLTRETKQAGKLEIAVVVDPATGAATGELTRSAGADYKAPPTSPISGLREIAPAKLPACLHPGVFDLVMGPKVTWKLSQGHPRFGDCKEDNSVITHATVRVEVLGNEVIVDEVDHDNTQSFSRGKVTRDADCEITLAYEQQDFKFEHAKLTFAGDKVTGRAAAATFQFMEDGDAGENLWACSAKHAEITGTRIAD